MFSDPRHESNLRAPRGGGEVPRAFAKATAGKHCVRDDHKAKAADAGPKPGATGGFHVEARQV